MKIMQKQRTSGLFHSVFRFVASHLLTLNYLLYACIYWSSFLCWSLVYLIQCFTACCMQGRHLSWEGGHIFRLFGVCPISMFVFCFMHWSEGSVLFDWCLVSLVLNYFRAGRMWIVWFPSFSLEISGPAAPAPIAFHSLENFEHQFLFIVIWFIWIFPLKYF